MHADAAKPCLAPSSPAWSRDRPSTTPESDNSQAHMQEAGVDEPLRFTATLTDGHTVWALRRACDARPATLYHKEGAVGLLLVSEPIDGDRGCWREIPRGGTLIATSGQPLRLERMDADLALMA